ncbi:phosphate regulon transcriptional regulator PhoB [Thiosulfativibrio zosterae]|uniref:Phosphate regulon transcriptional regulatory protein PhoB n=1 Tax=Thiosulfativibrio zosterae TaxID=2675053 RepID=A0A6F8PLE7_9GAMM|nr:phosphate regulon transcriptional regulator PhoB [Thiosulfativibrio zosterae]BBP42884.1 DNA-binding response regulator [Thiosulfativibrio zosterae]
MSEQTILVVEDEAAIRDMLNFTLSAANYKVMEAPNAETAWQMLNQTQPDCVLLDWMLPGVSGVALAQRIRNHEKFATMPIVLLTARGDESDQVQGFEAGADDYVVKPFSPRALVARIKALLRRQTSELEFVDVLAQGALRLDLSSYRFTAGDNEVKLGPTEFKLMQFFMSHPNRVYTRLQLLDQVWGEHVVVEERTVDVHIRRLRKLLEPVGQADMIQTVRGAGYRFSASE